MNMKRSTTTFPSLLQRFFCEYLINQRNVSRATVSSYRDAFRLLFRFGEERLGKAPASLVMADLDARLVLAFLDYLENDRRNSIRSRNLRLAAIRAFLRYAALQDPTTLDAVQRVLAIPLKRFDRTPVDYLSREEMTALLKAPDSRTWTGHRDRVMFTTLYNTGARVSELTGLNVDDYQSGQTGTVRLRGKGRKERIVPLWKSTRLELANWLRRLDTVSAGSPLFPNRRGERLTRSGVRTRLNAAAVVARKTCKSLQNHRVSPHLIRHTTAMHLLQSGVDITLIAIWLGHEGTDTTHMYVEADLAMKKRVIEKIDKPTQTPRKFEPSDRLLAFLESL